MWGSYNLGESNVRMYKPIRLVRVHEDDCDLIVIDIYQKNEAVFLACPIFNIQKNIHSIPHVGGYLNEYVCDNCKDQIKHGMHCECCDFDLCDECVVSGKTHEHSMFKVTGCYGINSYEKINIVDELIIPI